MKVVRISFSKWIHVGSPMVLVQLTWWFQATSSKSRTFVDNESVEGAGFKTTRRGRCHRLDAKWVCNNCQKRKCDGAYGWLGNKIVSMMHQIYLGRWLNNPPCGLKTHRARRLREFHRGDKTKFEAGAERGSWRFGWDMNPQDLLKPLNETQPWKEPHKKDQEVARPFWIYNIHNIWRLPVSSACVFSDVPSGRILDYSSV